jgi:hypothetical protein
MVNKPLIAFMLQTRAALVRTGTDTRRKGTHRLRSAYPTRKACAPAWSRYPFWRWNWRRGVGDGLPSSPIQSPCFGPASVLEDLPETFVSEISSASGES